jgi:hypothetical protein
MIWKTVAAFTLALALLAPATQALANVAANTEINNKATLTFDGGTASAIVTVTVALVPAQPNVIVNNATGAYTAPDTPALTDSVVVTSTANGPADYTVTPSVSGSTNTTSPSVSGGATVSIGATVTTGTSGTTYVTVPASGASGDDSTVNGIGVNDTIVFTVGGNTFTRQITSTTDNGDGTFSLNWSGATDVPASGVQVGEQKTVNLSVLPGTVNTPGTDITVTVQAVVGTSGVSDVTAANATPNSWTTPSPNVNMTKYVRNLTDSAANPSAGSGTTLTINSFSREYFTSGVTGQTDDTLEYVIVASNTGGADLTGCAISDLIPEDFVDLKTGVYGSDDVFYIDHAGTTDTFAAGAVGANQASFVAGSDPNLVVNVGTGASNALTGTIPAGQSVTISYQVTIK